MMKYVSLYEPKTNNGKVLLNTSGPTIIVPGQTGIFYHNQVAGVACGQRTIEGYALPVNLPVGKDEYFFHPRWWYSQYGVWKGRDLQLSMDDDQTFNRWCNNNHVFADLQKYLEKNIGYAEIVLSKDNVEAWIIIKIKQSIIGPANKKSLFYSTKTKIVQAVLTWDNCD